MTENKLNTGKPAVIVISSHVARGTVGNRAVVFALETLGFPVWEVPTIILPWHLGHGPGTRIVPDAEQFSALLRDLENAPWLGDVAAVVSGFLGDASQADAVASLVARVREKNSQALYLCDPVMGDKGGLYVPEATATALRDILVPLADIATPNLYELEWMAGEAFQSREDAIAAARRSGPPTMLVTSTPAREGTGVGNMLLNAEGTFFSGHAFVEKAPNGVGDVTGALFLAHLLNGASSEDALRNTTASVLEVLSRAAARGSDELMLETDAQSLKRPALSVGVEKLEPSPA